MELRFVFHTRDRVSVTVSKMLDRAQLETNTQCNSEFGGFIPHISHIAHNAILNS